MSDLRLKTVFRPLGHTQPLLDGVIDTPGFEIDYIDVPVLVKAFRRMVRELEFDVCEMALTTYLCAKSYGKPFTALPIFPARGLHHGAILYNTKSGIRHLKDLEGRTVGVNRGYTVTTGVWARGILCEQYGVDLDKVSWLLSGDEHVAEYQAPSNVSTLKGESRTLEDLLGEGEIDAAIGVKIDHPDVKPLIDDPDEVAFSALQDHGLYPINHTVVVRNELLDSHSDLAGRLFEAFAQAKRVYIERLRSGRIDNPTPADELNLRVMEAIGDPLPYGIEPNRAMLEKLMKYACEQHIIPRQFAIEDVFARGTETLRA